MMHAKFLKVQRLKLRLVNDIETTNSGDWELV